MATDLDSIIRKILIQQLETLPDDDQPLELDSIALINLLEEIERSCAIRVLPEELIPENFSSVRGIICFFQGKQ